MSRLGNVILELEINWSTNIGRAVKRGWIQLQFSKIFRYPFRGLLMPILLCCLTHPSTAKQHWQVSSTHVMNEGVTELATQDNALRGYRSLRSTVVYVL